MNKKPLLTLDSLTSMYSSRAVSSIFGLKAYPEILLPKSLTANNGFASRFSFDPAVTPRCVSRCTFSTSVTRTVERNASLAVDSESSLSNGTERPTSITATTLQDRHSIPKGSQATSVPWYLRQQASIPSQAQKPAEIPELPPKSPPLLETLLEYVSVTAGLDDLQLLDLRHLDPPPALGPKLIMLIGTARSEKHLHVAADRFCRWLRREHGLKANAAGLLGRNELKIKLRRKAKRMRMLANVGGSIPEGNIDDGIRTGWICCTIGQIEPHPDDMHMPGDNVQEFVGFREVKPGVNIVVQMFTEEKREETDLETLWGGVLRTHQRKDKTADEALEELEKDIKELDEDFNKDDDVKDIYLQERRSAHVTYTPPTNDLSNRPAAKPSTARFNRPRSSPGDIFPPASDS